ncbi:agmatine deiminase family protein [Arcobacteraceae bacterium]|nr:agmatine deiminase family protein [Arcobacteraceae bacterium]
MRLPAEWEKQEFVQLVFPHVETDWNDYLDEAIGTFLNIAKVIQQYQKCLIVAKDISIIKPLFINKKNLIFIEIDSNDTWSRDFGGITVENYNSLTVLDFKFNAWGEKFSYNLDDKITKELRLKDLLSSYKYKSIPFILEGGAIESNGTGVILTTSKCMMEKNRNPHLSKKQIESKLIEYFGAKKVLWLDSGYLEGDDTDSHIDTLARFVSVDTIVYQSCDDENDMHYVELQKMQNELSNFTQLNGNKFKLIKLPWIEAKYDDKDRLPATYANFLIINGALLVPTYNDKNDKKALEIFQNLFPKRDVLGIDCQTLIRQHGSLHCVTMQYPSLIKE